MGSHRKTTLFALTLLLCAGRAQAQPEPDRVPVAQAPHTDEQTVRKLVEQLNDDDWLQRDLATIELGELDPGITLEMLERQLGDSNLSAEQRARLQLAALRRYAERPKGALGVSFGTIRVGAIEVQPIPANPDFPATKVLMPGDQIAMVADRVIDGSFSLRTEILSREPGEALPVTVLRGEQVLHLNLILGSFDDLTGAVRMDNDLLRNALELRWTRLGRSQPQEKSIGEDLNLEAWTDAAFPSDRAPDPRKPNLHAPRGWIVGEGVRIETNSSGWSAAAIDIWTSADNLRESAQQRGMVLAGDRIQPMVALRLLLERERSQLKQRIEQTQGEQREALIAQLNALTARLDTISDRIERTRPTTSQP